MKKSISKSIDTPEYNSIHPFIEPALKKSLEEMEKSLNKSKNKKLVQGRRKPKEGTKRLQTVYEASRTFEYETIKFYNSLNNKDCKVVAFRRPVSQSPADVWMIRGEATNPISEAFLSKLALTQCKTTLDTKPPKRSKEEVKKFIDYCEALDASCLWAERWKVNKNKYIRRIQSYVFVKKEWVTVVEDFSSRI